MELRRTEVFRAVDRHQQMTVPWADPWADPWAVRGEAAEGGERSAICKRRQGPREQPEQGIRRHRVEHVADVIVGRDLADPEQPLAIRPPPTTFHCPLVRQKRRALHEEDRKHREPDVGHRKDLTNKGSVPCWS